jgi:ankyrin repeat protein
MRMCGYPLVAPFFFVTENLRSCREVLPWSIMVEPLGAVTGLIGTCDVIARTTLAIIKYVAEVKAAPKDFERISSELEALEAVTSALQGFLKSARVSKLNFSETAPISIFIEKCRNYVVELEAKFTAQRSKSRLLWPMSGKSEIEKALQQIERYTNLFHLALSTNGWSYFCKEAEEAKEMLKQELEEWREIKKAIEPLSTMASDVEHIEGHCQVVISMMDMLIGEDIPAKLQALERGLQVQRDEEAAKERELLLGRLSKEDFLVKHRHVLSTHSKGTALWAVQMLQDLGWKTELATRTLWCHGMPGSGKTVTFSVMVDQLKNWAPFQNGIVAAVYLDYKSTHIHDLSTVLAGMIKQLVETSCRSSQLDSALKEMEQAFAIRKQGSYTIGDMTELLRKFSDSGHKITLCFDGLDETSDTFRTALSRWISEAASIFSLRTLLMSRSHIEIRHRTEIFDERQLIVPDTDIEASLKAKIGQTDFGSLLPDDMSPGLIDEIVSAIISRSKGMFLLADLQFAQLKDAVSEREVRELLQNMPERINDQYHTYFERIRTQSQGRLGLRAIAWIHLANRPLTVTELLEALSVRNNDTRLEPTGMMKLERLLSLTGGLVVHEVESGHLRLVHETLEEYLNTKHSIELPDTHLSVLETLHTYLQFRAFDMESRFQSTAAWADRSAVAREHRLLDYAFRYWSFHVNESQIVTRVDAPLIGEAIATKIASCSFLISLMMSVELLPHPLINGIGFSPVHIASLWQCPSVLRKILKSSPKAKGTTNCASELGITPLHLATIVNNSEIVSILIEAGASVVAKDYTGRTAAYWGAYCSSAKTLEVLLTSDVATSSGLIDLMNATGETPLHVALQRGYHKIAQLLIEGGANLLVCTLSGQTPLHYAVRYCPMSVDVLLKQGVNLEQKSTNGRTALLWACVLGDEECILRLLQAKADTQVRDNVGDSPLHILIQHATSPLPAAVILLDHGASYDGANDANYTSLALALKGRHYAVANLLLKRGADKHAASGHNQSLFVTAAALDDCPADTWDLLGDVNTLGHDGEGAIHHAAKAQSVSQLNNLLTHGANIEFRNALGQTALHLAVRHFVKQRHQSHSMDTKSDIVRTLLNRGASIYVHCHAGLTPLDEALEKLSVHLLQVLCSSQSKLELHKKHGASLLEFCINEKAPESLGCLGILLQYGLGVEGHPSPIPPLSLAVKELIELAPKPRPYLTHGVRSNSSPHKRSLKGRLKSDIGTTSAHVSERAILKCQHPGSCSEIELVCKKIYLLLSMGAKPDKTVPCTFGNRTPAEALKEFVTTQVYTKLEDYEVPPCDRLLKTLALEDISNPAALIRKRKQLDREEDFEWNDKLSLLLDARRHGRQSVSFLQVPNWAKASSISEGFRERAASYRRPSVFDPLDSSHNATKQLNSYDRTRKALWQAKER